MPLSSSPDARSRMARPSNLRSTGSEMVIRPEFAIIGQMTVLFLSWATRMELAYFGARQPCERTTALFYFNSAERNGIITGAALLVDSFLPVATARPVKRCDMLCKTIARFNASAYRNKNCRLARANLQSLRCDFA